MIFFGRNYESQVIENLIGTGNLAVRFFFSVCGFLLFLQMKRRSQTDLRPKLNFYARRFFRIYPLWFFTICLCWYLYKLDFSVVAANLSFAFGFFAYDIKMTPVTQAWSLFVEEFFYIIFPLIFLFTQRLTQSLIALASTALIAWIWLNWAAHFGVPSTQNFIEFFPLAHLHYFFIGIATYHVLHLQIWQRYKNSTIFKHICDFAAALSVAGLGTGLANSWTALCIFLMFISICNERSLFSKFCSLKWIQQIGKCCYPLYLIHLLVLIKLYQPVMQWLNSAFEREPSAELIFLFGFPLFTVLCLLIAFILSYGIERPIIKWGNRFVANLNLIQ